MINSSIPRKESSLVYIFRLSLVILITHISVIFAQSGFFTKQPWNVSPSSRCKYFFEKAKKKTKKKSLRKSIVNENFLVLSLFTIYKWNNGWCTATSGEFGICLPDSDCLIRGGIPGGPCAQGYGLCCVCKVSP